MKDACESYKLDYIKSEFDHNKIKNWDDVYKYKNEVLPYLKLDVLSLNELIIKFSKEMKELKLNIYDYLTLSSMGYAYWKRTISEFYKKEIGDSISDIISQYIKEKNKTRKEKIFEKLSNVLIFLPDESLYKIIRKAIIGGRCYPRQKKYVSSLYDRIIKAGTKEERMQLYKELVVSQDYIFAADVCSLYPAVMRGVEGLIDVYYPIGETYQSSNPKKEFDSGKLGFYEVTFQAPKNLFHPRISYRNDCRLIWGLEKSTSWLTSVDIEDMLEIGYEITDWGKTCYVYKSKTKKNNSPFKYYIDTFYEMKKIASLEESKDPVKRNIAKLLMNSLYGKMLQQAFSESTFCHKNHEDVLKFLNSYDLVSWKEFNNNLIITGEKKDFKTCITKPSQFGAFVLAYSRRLCYNYFKECGLDKHFMIYGDTDSMYIFGEYHQKLLKNGYIRKDELGYLSNDAKGNEPLIIKQISLSPKCYTYLSLDKDGELKTNSKSKGIPKKYLKEEMYEKEDIKHQVEYNILEKKNLKLSKEDEKNGIELFSIKQRKCIKEFNANKWESMVLRDNIYYPLGYNMNDCIYKPKTELEKIEIKHKVKQKKIPIKLKNKI